MYVTVREYRAWSTKYNIPVTLRVYRGDGLPAPLGLIAVTYIILITTHRLVSKKDEELYKHEDSYGTMRPSNSHGNLQAIV